MSHHALPKDVWAKADAAVRERLRSMGLLMALPDVSVVIRRSERDERTDVVQCVLRQPRAARSPRSDIVAVCGLVGDGAVFEGFAALPVSTDDGARPSKRHRPDSSVVQVCVASMRKTELPPPGANNDNGRRSGSIEGEARAVDHRRRSITAGGRTTNSFVDDTEPGGTAPGSDPSHDSSDEGAEEEAGEEEEEEEEEEEVEEDERSDGESAVRRSARTDEPDAARCDAVIGALLAPTPPLRATVMDRIAPYECTAAAVALTPFLEGAKRDCTRTATPSDAIPDGLLRRAYPSGPRIPGSGGRYTDPGLASWFGIAAALAAADHSRWDDLVDVGRFLADCSARTCRADDPAVVAGEALDAYEKDQDGSWVSLVDGRTLDPMSREGDIVASTATTSLVRNERRPGAGEKAPIVFSLPQRVALARSLAGCADPSCRSQPCRHVRLAIGGGRTWATADDVRCCAWVLAGMQLNRAAGRLCAATGVGQALRAPDIAAGVSACRERGEAAAVQAASARMRVKDATPESARRCGEAARALVTDAARAAGGCWGAVRTATGFGEADVLAFASYAGTAGLWDAARVQQRRGCARPAWGTSSHRPSAGRRTRREACTLPGYAELSGSGWQATSIARWLPPCIRKTVEECSTVRHPRYQERMLTGTLLAAIDGFADDHAGFVSTWKSLFMHPETALIPKGDSPAFDASKYGTTCIEDIVGCVGRVPFGCRFAAESKLCPYAYASASVDTQRSSRTAARTDQTREPPRLQQEEPVISDESQQHTPEEPHRARCRSDLERTLGRVLPYVTPRSYFRNSYFATRNGAAPPPCDAV
jgi:hypothetical protein